MTFQDVTLLFPSSAALGPALSRAMHSFPLRIPGLLTGSSFFFGQGFAHPFTSTGCCLSAALLMFAQPGQGWG